MAPIQLFGNWEEGYALDVYIESSEYIGEDVFGHPMFDSTYSRVGALLHRMKYKCVSVLQRDERIKKIYYLAIAKTKN